METLQEGVSKRFRIPRGLDGFFQSPTTDELVELSRAIDTLRDGGHRNRAAVLEGLDHKVKSALKAEHRRRISPDVEALSRAELTGIYHYAPYEMTALKRLAMKYATREAELDQLLRDKRFVDLYAVVRQGIRASTESYSLKDLEKIYWGKREGEVTNAGDSIVEYERWRELGDQAILDAIERYNEDDCVSTAKLRDWLEGLRPADAPFGLAPPESDEPKPEPSAKARERAEFETAS